MVAREPHTPPSPPARRARPRPRQGKQPGSEVCGGSAGSQCSSRMRYAAGNSGTQGAKEQWKLRGGSSSRLKVAGARVRKCFGKQRGSSPPGWPPDSSWRCVRVGAKRHPRQGLWWERQQRSRPQCVARECFCMSSPFPAEK